MKWKWLALASVAVVSLLSVAISLGYSLPLVHGIPGQDVTGHFLAMGWVCFCMNRGYANSRSAIPGITLLVALGATFDEVTQILIPARQFSLLDLGANYAGIASAATVAALRTKSFPRAF
jgi:VanZ family protein